MMTDLDINDAWMYVTWEFGMSIDDAIPNMIVRARDLNCIIRYNFNGVIISAAPDSDPNLLFRDWRRASSGFTDKNVGPYPAAVLTQQELENDRRIEAKNNLSWKRSESAYKGWATRRRNALSAKLADAPEMEISDEAIWENYKSKNQDGYGGGIIAYAERWARLMQVEINEGKKLEDIAETTSHEADIDGISGFMYGAAVHTLANSWKHGEQLRRWHNLDTQLGSEGEEANESGGVLNPALLSIG